MLRISSSRPPELMTSGVPQDEPRAGSPPSRPPGPPGPRPPGPPELGGGSTASSPARSCSSSTAPTNQLHDPLRPDSLGGAIGVNGRSLLVLSILDRHRPDLSVLAHRVRLSGHVIPENDREKNPPEIISDGPLCNCLPALSLGRSRFQPDWLLRPLLLAHPLHLCRSLRKNFPFWQDKPPARR